MSEPTQSVEPNSNPTENQIYITDQSKKYLLSTAKWGKFFAILGFVFSGLMVLLGLSFGSIMSFLPYQDPMMDRSFFSTIFFLIYVIMGVIYFVPSLFLFKYAKYSKNAILTNNNSELELAHKNQNKMYWFWGVCTLIILGLYALMFIGMAITVPFLT